MKCFTHTVMFIALVAFVTADEEWKPISDREILRKIHEDCVRENALTSEQIKKVYNKEHPEHPDEKEVRGYVLCSVKKIGVFTEDEGFSVDRLMSQFDGLFYDAEKARDIVTKCVDSNEQNSTAAVWAFRGHQCMVNSRIGAVLNKRKNTE